WETATEINNDYFVVERASEDLDWRPILTVTGAGNSNSLLTYSEKDREPLKGLSYYRLKQVDYDGQFSYSEPVAIFNNQVENSEDVFMYPNPSSLGSVFLRIPEGLNGFRTELRLFDLSGKLLQTELYDANSDVYEMKYGDLIPGIYLIQINSEMLNDTKKLVVK
ncbi:T9SS type A sorting domain-containing protein, partial [Cryomorphaceae bacterium 1068]|nr:T9SS type A sorting domain-containing protein [Cryomorphaceae bacterium 1068]